MMLTERMLLNLAQILILAQSLLALAVPPCLAAERLLQATDGSGRGARAWLEFPAVAEPRSTGHGAADQTVFSSRALRLDPRGHASEMVGSGDLFLWLLAAPFGPEKVPAPGCTKFSGDDDDDDFHILPRWLRLHVSRNHLHGDDDDDDFNARQ